jgi:glyoxylase-like metal-dependent hydrolase (beta-lactamase superfamily II)
MSLFGKSIVVNVDKWVDDFDTMKVGNMELLFLYTPGHTKGGMCILTEGHLFSGDTLFRYSIGRTDFYGGSWPQLEKSIKNKLYTLPDDTVVLPGHMGFTTIGDEKKGNPFVR